MENENIVEQLYNSTSDKISYFDRFQSFYIGLVEEMESKRGESDFLPYLDQQKDNANSLIMEFERAVFLRPELKREWEFSIATIRTLLNTYDIEVKRQLKDTKNEAVNSQTKSKPAGKIKLELNKSQIVYFLDELIKAGIIKQQYNTNYLELASRFFTDINGENFSNANLSTAKYNYENNKAGKPKNTTEIDALIDNIKNKKDID